MTSRPESPIFTLPAPPSPKSDPALVAADEQHLAVVSRTLDAELARLSAERDHVLATPARGGQEAIQRDADVRRLGTRLRSLRGIALDACLGRMTPSDGSPRRYIGRLGLKDSGGDSLLLDWRSPAAAPYFAATRAEPSGLASRRRYRWAGAHVRDFWDESLGAGAGEEAIVPDDESVFLDELAAARTPRMRDVLATIASDQDAIVRADARRSLVVDGGPGTGKTVVALHRAAYLHYTDARLREGRGRLLFLGPHRPYLAYVADVLPNLGEDDVLTCTLADLVPEGAGALPDADERCARVKGDARMLQAVGRAIRISEEPPSSGLDLETDAGEVHVAAADWAEAFAAPDRSTPHNLAHTEILDELAEILADRRDQDGEGPSAAMLRDELERDERIADVLRRAWPMLDAAQVVADLWEVPALLRHAAPWLDAEERALLRRPAPQRWTTADLPLIDAARDLLGDPHAASRLRRRAADRTRTRAEMDDVVEDLIASDDSELLQMSMLRGEDMRAELSASAELPELTPDPLAGPFLHVVVDEAQELSDAQWAMVLRRCPSRSLTIVGDRAQASEGFTGSWQERLARVGLDRVDVATLEVNYRTPAEIMAEAEPVIRAEMPDANVPTSIRESGVPVRRGRIGDLAAIVHESLESSVEGTLAVIGAPVPVGVRSERVRSCTPSTAKGLEFDVVVLVDPDSWGSGRAGAAARYVAMTRATRELVILTPEPGGADSGDLV